MAQLATSQSSSLFMEDALHATGQSNSNQRILNVPIKNHAFVSTMASLRLVTSRRNMLEGSYLTIGSYNIGGSCS